MRNEGPFIVEWLCWQRMLGFTDAVVVTNNCTDASPALLDALVAGGWVHHLRHDMAPGQPVTAAKLQVAFEHRAVRRANWVMVCDVDEFLVIHRGAGRLDDLIGTGAPEFLGMSINWRVFGHNKIEEFHDIPVHQQFFGAVGDKSGISLQVKSIFRQPRWFRALGEHGPIKLMPDKTGLAWGDPGMVWVNCDGRPVPGWKPGSDQMRNLPVDLSSHKTAQINHYMLRAAETFSLKKGTPSPVQLSNRYSGIYVKRANRADVIDRSALRRVDEFNAIYQEAMALPEVARMHHQCCADHLQAIFAKVGRDAALDPRYVGHLARAK